MKDIDNLQTLIKQLEQGSQPKYLFFWGHTPHQEGQVDKACFSQWYAAAFTVDGTHYATAEHYMMAEKARLFGDEATRQQIVVTHTPAEAKALGRMVSGFDNATWNKHRVEIVKRGNLAKFSQNAALGEFLRNTAPRVLVEASPLDRIWGIGLAADDPNSTNPHEWRGLNLLGFVLMQVRAEL